MSVIDAEKHAATRVFIKATAGMRLLAPPAQDAIFDALAAGLGALAPAAFPFRCGARTSGPSRAPPGLHGLLSANYLQKRIDAAAPTTDARPVALDLGGSSTQIVFQPPEQSCLSADGSPAPCARATCSCAARARPGARALLALALHRPPPFPPPLLFRSLRATAQQKPLLSLVRRGHDRAAARTTARRRRGRGRGRRTRARSAGTSRRPAATEAARGSSGRATCRAASRAARRCSGTARAPRRRAGSAASRCPRSRATRSRCASSSTRSTPRARVRAERRRRARAVAAADARRARARGDAFCATGRRCAAAACRRPRT